MVSSKKWHLLGLFLISTLIMFILFFGYRKRKAPESGQGASKMNAPGSKKDQVHDLTKKTKEEASLSTQLKLLNRPWGRDLFSLDSLKTKGFKTPELPLPGLRSTNERLLDINLTGIVFFDNHYMALINDAAVREGNVILGFKVLKIKRDYIVLVDGSGDFYTLDLK